MNKIKLLTQLKRYNYDGNYEYVLKELIHIVSKQQEQISNLQKELDALKSQV